MGGGRGVSSSAVAHHVLQCDAVARHIPLFQCPVRWSIGAKTPPPPNSTGGSARPRAARSYAPAKRHSVVLLSKAHEHCFAARRRAHRSLTACAPPVKPETLKPKP